jgi:hypothetical protein
MAISLVSVPAGNCKRGATSEASFSGDRAVDVLQIADSERDRHAI